MKLCKDCRWFADDSGECHHMTSARDDLVHGGMLRYQARTMRESILKDDCGQAAQYFQPRLSEAA